MDQLQAGAPDAASRPADLPRHAAAAAGGTALTPWVGAARRRCAPASASKEHFG